MEPMDEHNEANFKALIRAAGSETPSDHFAQSVMKQVQHEEALRALLKQNAPEAPSRAFQASVMAQIQATQPAPKPFTFAKTGYWMAAAWAVLLVACFFIPANDQSQALVSGLLRASQLSAERITGIPQPFMLTIIGLSGLLLTDYMLRNRRLVIHKNGQVV